jgi:hypothetical protein
MSLALKPKAAQANDHDDTPFTGSLTVQFEFIATSGACAIGDANCNLCVSTPGAGYIEAQGMGDTSLGSLFVEVLKCANPPTSSAPFGSYTGTLTTTAPNRKDSMTLAYSGKNDTAGDPYGFQPFSGTLTITGGTGKFEDAHGSASFTAVGGPGSVGPSPNTFVGMAFYSVHGNIESRDND